MCRNCGIRNYDSIESTMRMCSRAILLKAVRSQSAKTLGFDAAQRRALQHTAWRFT